MSMNLATRSVNQPAYPNRVRCRQTVMTTLPRA